MKEFLTQHQSVIKGVLSGFDRVRFRGTIRWLATLHGMGSFLGTIRILMTQFRSWATEITTCVKQDAVQVAEHAGRPVIYLASSSRRKEFIAMEIAEQDGIRDGLICVITCVEPCHTFSVGPSGERKKLELRHGPGKCLHQYFYFLDPQFGLMHLRMQTWLPLTINICINGREWLANQLRTAGIGFRKRDNCFVHVDDVAAAQNLLDQQLQTNWSSVFNSLLLKVQPGFKTLFPRPLDYYWSADETEWATDVMFDSPKSLAAIYPNLVKHAVTQFDTVDVMRFLGRRVGERVHHRFEGDVITTLKTREEGTRVKHDLNGNSIKMYDKEGSDLRVETTINHSRDMKVFRTKENDPDGPMTWQRLRKGVADLHRRATISQQANERYLDSLAAVENTEPLKKTISGVCRPATLNGRRVRPLSPLSPDDSKLLESVARSEFRLNGFRNRDLRSILYGAKPSCAAELKRQASRITRQIRLLRAHGLVRKVTGSQRYQLTSKGQKTITAILAAQNASTKQLTQLAV
ncbi:MAG: hypothetical protein JNL58_29330 [Planctomyces sp.]|nr:hypothetical protein [Planctomyces sp.]